MADNYKFEVKSECCGDAVLRISERDGLAYLVNGSGRTIKGLLDHWSKITGPERTKDQIKAAHAAVDFEDLLAYREPGDCNRADLAVRCDSCGRILWGENNLQGPASDPAADPRIILEGTQQ